MKTVTISKPTFNALKDARSFAPIFVGELLEEAYESRGGWRQITYEEDQREELVGLIRFVVSSEKDEDLRYAKHNHGEEAPPALFLSELEALIARM